LASRFRHREGGAQTRNRATASSPQPEGKSLCGGQKKPKHSGPPTENRAARKIEHNKKKSVSRKEDHDGGTPQHDGGAGGGKKEIQFAAKECQMAWLTGPGGKRRLKNLVQGPISILFEWKEKCVGALGV